MQLTLTERICYSLFGLIVICCIVMFVASCDSTHTAPTLKPVILRWVAPGDDGFIGQAARYEARMATDSMQLKNSWSTCTQITAFNTKVPAPGGQKDSLQFSIMVETGITYYIAVKTADEVPNWSLISWLWSAKWDDVDSPAQITDLTGSKL